MRPLDIQTYRIIFDEMDRNHDLEDTQPIPSVDRPDLSVLSEEENALRVEIYFAAAAQRRSLVAPPPFAGKDWRFIQAPHSSLFMDGFVQNTFSAGTNLSDTADITLRLSAHPQFDDIVAVFQKQTDVDDQKQLSEMLRITLQQDSLNISHIQTRRSPKIIDPLVTHSIVMNILFHPVDSTQAGVSPARAVRTIDNSAQNVKIELDESGKVIYVRGSNGRERTSEREVELTFQRISAVLGFDPRFANVDLYNTSHNLLSLPHAIVQNPSPLSEQIKTVLPLVSIPKQVPSV